VFTFKKVVLFVITYIIQNKPKRLSFPDINLVFELSVMYTKIC